MKGWRDVPLTQCGFNKRLTTALEKCGAQTLGEASQIPIADILKHANCGYASVAPLEAVLRFIHASDE